jgi:hypothetical protein
MKRRSMTIIPWPLSIPSESRAIRKLGSDRWVHRPLTGCPEVPFPELEPPVNRHVIALKRGGSDTRHNMQ